MAIQGIQASLSPKGFNMSGNGMPPKSYSLSELDIRMPSIFQDTVYAAKGKGVQQVHGVAAAARTPAPNVIILINNPKDGIAINGTYINAPHRTLVIVAHGGPDGVLRSDGSKYYSATDLAKLIKQKAGTKFSQYDQIVLVSCRVALAGKSNDKTPKQDGSYTQIIANALGKPVYAATEFGYVHANGRLTIAGSTTPTSGARRIDNGDLGRFIRFDPGGKPAYSSSLQSALKEQANFPENSPGAGATFDKEFDTTKTGRCVNATVSQCIGK